MKLLSFEEFESHLEELLDERYPERWEHIGKVFKVNEIKQGISIEMDDKISAVVYPDELYKAYQAEESMDIVAEIIACALNQEFAESIELFSDWEEVKRYIKPFVINFDRNQDFIKQKNLVYQKKLDLAYGYYIELENSALGEAATYVSREMLDYWKVSESDLRKAAKENTKFRVISMRKAIEEMLEDSCMSLPVDIDDSLLVLSNKKRVRGAGGLFETELLKQVADKIQRNFYILPSSIHEAILVKDDGNIDPQELKAMVETINRTEIKTDEYLSDSIYYYDRVKNEIVIAA